jgi:hypothetical protein
MKTQSEFIFRKVVNYGPADSDRFPHGLVNVYERERPVDGFVGQLHPARGGGYLLRNRDGVNLADIDCGRTPGFVALSREPAARLLRNYVQRQEQRMAARVGTVSEGCPNTWHNTADYRGKTACPECPSAIGLRIAVQQLRSAARVAESGGDDPGLATEYADDLEDLIYHAPDAS